MKRDSSRPSVLITEPFHSLCACCASPPSNEVSMEPVLRRQLSLLFLVLLCGFSLVNCEGGCSCGEASSTKVSKEPTTAPTAALPTVFPHYASETAPVLAVHVPQGVEMALFVSSHGQMIQIIDDFKQWGLVKASQVDNAFTSLAAYYGVHPGRADSYAKAGLDLTGPAVIGKIGTNLFVIAQVTDYEALSSAFDHVVNEEYGRPRLRLSKHKATELSNFHVLATDFATTAYRDGLFYFVSGAYFDEEKAPREEQALPSREVMERLLDITPTDSLAQHPGFTPLLQRTPEHNLFLFFPNGDLASSLLMPFMKEEGAPLHGILDPSVFKRITGVGAAVKITPKRLDFEAFALVPPEELEGILKIVTPDPPAAGKLASTMLQEPRGLTRLTFEPKELEEKLLSFLTPKKAKAWRKLKKDKLRIKKYGVTLVDVEAQILHNFSGQLLMLLNRIDEEALERANDDLDKILDAVDAVLYLPFKDPSASDGLFGKVGILKGAILDNKQLKKYLRKIRATLAIEDIKDSPGSLVFTLRKKRKTGKENGQLMLQLAYHKGALLLVTGQQDIAPLLAQLGTDKGWSPPKGSPLDRLLDDGALWGGSVDAQVVKHLLSSRFKSFRSQIQRYLAPLRRLSFQVRFEKEGVGIDFGIEMKGTDSSDGGK